MNDTEAKLRLAACRPGGLDANDPQMREALQELSRSPALNTWFEQQQAFDEAMASLMRTRAVPDTLQAEILAAAKLSGSTSRRWTRPRMWLAAAAVIMAAILTGVLLRPPLQPTLAAYRSDIATQFVRMKQQGFQFDETGADVGHLNAFLVKHRAPSADTLQPGLQSNSQPLGCHILEWRGRKVSMICFRKNHHEAHLFVIDRQAIRDSVIARSTAPERINGYPVASWTDARHAYVLVGDSPGTDLTTFL